MTKSARSRYLRMRLFALRKDAHQTINRDWHPLGFSFRNVIVSLRHPVQSITYIRIRLPVCPPVQFVRLTNHIPDFNHGTSLPVSGQFNAERRSVSRSSGEIAGHTTWRQLSCEITQSNPDDGSRNAFAA